MAAAHKGVMVCLYPPKDVAKQFAVDAGETPDNMHVTLAYLGKLDELPDDAVERAVEACQSVAASQGKLSGEIGGIGRWAAGDEDCVYASVDLPGANEFRAALMDALAKAGLEPRANHGWSAHMTVQYLPKDAAIKVHSVEPVPVEFGSVWVVSGDTDRHEVKFGGADGTVDMLEAAVEMLAARFCQKPTKAAVLELLARRLQTL